MGIEPTRPAWKAGILPLNYTRIFSSRECSNIISHLFAFVNTFFNFFKLFFIKILLIAFSIDKTALLY